MSKLCPSHFAKLMIFVQNNRKISCAPFPLPYSTLSGFDEAANKANSSLRDDRASKVGIFGCSGAMQIVGLIGEVAHH
jgi:hypothetical protein